MLAFITGHCTRVWHLSTPPACKPMLRCCWSSWGVDSYHIPCLRAATKGSYLGASSQVEQFGPEHHSLTRTYAWHPHTQMHTHVRTSSNSNTVALSQDGRCKARMHVRLHSITWSSSGRENAGEASAGILTLNDKKYMVVVGEHPKGSDKNGVTLIYDLSAKVCSQIFPMGLQHVIA
jgi:hypothetical protein